MSQSNDGKKRQSKYPSNRAYKGLRERDHARDPGKKRKHEEKLPLYGKEFDRAISVQSFTNPKVHYEINHGEARP